jgi:exonuclease III
MNGFRIDYVFANAAFLEAFKPICHYDHPTRETKISDHGADRLSWIA